MSDPYPWGAFAIGTVVAAGAATAVLLATFGVALTRGVHRIVDVAWGLAFTAVAISSYGMSSGQGEGARRALVLTLTMVWGLRLAGHIAWRGRGHGEDPRYDALLAKARGNRTAYALRAVYGLQAALAWLVSLPLQAAAFIPGPLGPAAVAGCALWLFGLCFEAVGDYQLGRFQADPGNRGRLMDQGLWSWTRHPNYFGEFCVWWGFFLIACDDWRAAALSLVSPLTMSYLLTRGSGKALLERRMRTTRPTEWPAYEARTSGFLPRPPKRRAGEK